MRLFQNLGHRLRILFLYEHLQSCHRKHVALVELSCDEFLDENLLHQVDR